MNIESIFSFLMEDYGFEFQYQRFDKCYGGNWTVDAFSFYNDTGCFTIHSLVQHGGELDFYYSPRFSTSLEDLCSRGVDIRSIEKDIWKKHEKIGAFPRPFFWLRNHKVLEALSDVLKEHIAKHGEFFGIHVR